MILTEGRKVLLNIHCISINYKSEYFSVIKHVFIRIYLFTSYINITENVNNYFPTVLLLLCCLFGGYLLFHLTLRSYMHTFRLFCSYSCIFSYSLMNSIVPFLDHFAISIVSDTILFIVNRSKRILIFIN